MMRPAIAPLMVAATLLTAGCANSYLHDEEFGRRVEAESAAANARWDRFWGGIVSEPARTEPRGSIWDPQPCGGSGWRTTSFCVR